LKVCFEVQEERQSDFILVYFAKFWIYLSWLIIMHNV